MVTNVPHLFTLNPIASDIVKKIAKGRKSKQVSSAIIWYYKKKPEVKELVEANAQLMERYNLAMIFILKKVVANLLFRFLTMIIKELPWTSKKEESRLSRTRFQTQSKLKK